MFINKGKKRGGGGEGIDGMRHVGIYRDRGVVYGRKGKGRKEGRGQRVVGYR